MLPSLLTGRLFRQRLGRCAFLLTQLGIFLRSAVKLDLAPGARPPTGSSRGQRSRFGQRSHASDLGDGGTWWRFESGQPIMLYLGGGWSRVVSVVRCLKKTISISEGPR